MYFWCICGEEGDLHILLLCHSEGPLQEKIFEISITLPSAVFALIIPIHIENELCPIGFHWRCHSRKSQVERAGSLISDLWCCYYKKIMTCWRLRWWLAFFSKKVFFFCLAMPCGLWDLSPEIEPRSLAVKAQSPNHWTAREFPRRYFFKLRYVHYIFRHDAIAHLIDYSINITFICTRKPKEFVWLTLFGYSLYCSGLELNLQYLQGMPVICVDSINYRTWSYNKRILWTALYQ